MTSLIEIYRRFPTPEAAVAHLEKMRWGDKPACPYCGADTAARHNEAGGSRWQCWTCRRSFSATVGTIFHNSHIDLQRWFLLIALMLNAKKKGLSAIQAARDLDMRRPTVWSMMHRIRGAMQDDGKLLSGLVEMDEAYIGGKPRRTNRKDDNDPKPRGRGTSKTPIVGAVERGGRVKAKVIASRHKPNLSPAMTENIEAGSHIITDEFSTYAFLDTPYVRDVVNHALEYVNGHIHTNGIENFWSLLLPATVMPGSSETSASRYSTPAAPADTGVVSHKFIVWELDSA